MSPMLASAGLNQLQQLQYLLVRPPVVVRTVSRRPSLRVSPRAAAPVFDVELGDGVRQSLCATATVVQTPL